MSVAESDWRAVQAPSVSQRERNLVSVLNDVIVSHDKTLRQVHDDAAARGAYLALCRQFRGKRWNNRSFKSGVGSWATRPLMAMLTTPAITRWSIGTGVGASCGDCAPVATPAVDCDHLAAIGTKIAARMTNARCTGASIQIVDSDSDLQLGR
jgi:hypothetical protein